MSRVMIEQNDIAENIPPILEDMEVVYSELPFRVGDEEFKSMVKNLKKLADIRRDKGLPTYYIVRSDKAVLFDNADAVSDIYLCMETGLVTARLVQYKTLVKTMKNTAMLINYLRTVYKSAGDPCAGTGRTSDCYEYSAMFDNDPEMVIAMKNRYGIKIEDDIVLDKEKEEL